MARKNYTDEFRRQAVDLYRSTPGATLRGIAADLGISRHTLNDWVDAQTATAGTTGADATAGWADADPPAAVPPAVEPVTERVGWLTRGR